MVTKKRAQQQESASVHFCWDARRKRWNVYGTVLGMVVWSQPVETTVAATPHMVRGVIRAIQKELESQLPFS